MAVLADAKVYVHLAQELVVAIAAKLVAVVLAVAVIFVATHVTITVRETIINS